MKSSAKVFTTVNDDKTSISSSYHHSYCLEIKPFLILRRCFGKLPYSFDKNGHIKFKLFSFPVLYTVAFYLVQLVTTAIGLHYLIIEKISNAKSFDEALFWSSAAIFILQNIILPLVTFWECRGFSAYLESWNHLQVDFIKCRLKMTMKRWCKILALVSVPIAIGLPILQTYLLSDLNVKLAMPLAMAMGEAYLYIIMFDVSLYEIRNLGRVLKNDIGKETLSELHCNRLLWVKLCNISNGIGEACGISGLCTITIEFITFVLSGYGLLSYISDPPESISSFFGLGSIVISCEASIFAICNSAYSTSQVLGQDFIKRLLEINVEPYSKYSQDVSLFLQTIVANQPAIQFSGFITINRTLLVSLLSSTVTYLIVLIQFKTSPVGFMFVNATKNFVDV